MCFWIVFAERCVERLVQQQYSSSFTASSYYSALYTPSYGRFQGSGGWSPQTSDRLPWLQVNLSQRSKIIAISTQGTYNSNDWVTKYLFLYSDQGKNWKPFYQQGHNWTFAGNQDSDTEKRHLLWRPVLAQFVRFVAISWRRGHAVGLRVEVFGCPYDSEVSSFDGNSTLSYKFGNSQSTHTLRDSISFNFKTLETDGLLLHSEGKEGDYITVELERARLLFHINLGSSNVHLVNGETLVTLGSLLDDDHWHMVTIERYGPYVNLTLDGDVEHIRCNGNFDHLDLDSQIFFGGMVTGDKHRLKEKANFRGCLENIMYNNVSVSALARAKNLEIHTTGDVMFRCPDLLYHEIPFSPITFSSPNSYIQVPSYPSQSQFTLSFRFRSFDNSGMLLFSNFSDGVGSFEMGLSNGQINITFLSLDLDGHWHSLQLTARMDTVIVTIDEDEGAAVRINSALRVSTGDYYFLGGTYFLVPRYLLVPLTFHGCMQEIRVENRLVDLELVKRRRLGSYAEMLFNTCGIADRCTPNLCEHGGICIQTWDNFECDCHRTGYKGPTCHNSLYPESCHHYRLLGVRTSGNYTIDPDGSGSARPFVVYCTMTEDTAWTTVFHLQERDTKVTGSSLEKPFVGHIDYYNNTEEEIAAITLGAEYCEQKIAFSCYRSRLLNSPSGLPYAWWLGREAEKHFYWGDASPWVQRCSCGMHRGCSDPKYYCNCDADYKQWNADRGLLKYREHLPVTKVVIGDTNRTGSEARFHVGPLRCYGDGGSWNVASFVHGNYLSFPTFMPGPSLDISFYFKTTSSSGVFLENSGIVDFIRLELRSNREVALVFDVGDGQEQLLARSPVALDDDDWHWVQAEINVVFARLKLDELPWQRREAPPQSYVNLRFNKPLFVGAAEYRLQAFFGCIRGLKMNGEILDLEKKANETEGVNAGCVGHCEKPRVECQNGGRCIERYSTYTCDCNASAFDGPFCSKVVGGYFEPGTYIRYSFQSVVSAVAGTMANLMLPLIPGHNLTNEEIVFSFSTEQPPGVLLYVSSYTLNDAVCGCVTGSLELRYRLGGSAYPYTRTIAKDNMADNKPHRVNITRRDREVYTQVHGASTHLLPLQLLNFDSPKSLFLGRVMEIGVLDPDIQRFNTPGFTGCLAGFSFNGIVPIKAALRSDVNHTVNVSGTLLESNCGAPPVTLSLVSLEEDPWQVHPGETSVSNAKDYDCNLFSLSLLSLVFVALFLFLLLAFLLFLFLYYYRHKGSYLTNEAKPLEPSGSSQPAPPKELRARGSSLAGNKVTFWGVGMGWGWHGRGGGEKRWDCIPLSSVVLSLRSLPGTFITSRSTCRQPCSERSCVSLSRSLRITIFSTKAPAGPPPIRLPPPPFRLPLCTRAAESQKKLPP
uniref:Contactin associated protein 1 n=1 Tax=Callorhinchus milii TaxID=7868 RepID=A0A4W3HSX6_CALMI